MNIACRVGSQSCGNILVTWNGGLATTLDRSYVLNPPSRAKQTHVPINPPTLQVCIK